MAPVELIASRNFEHVASKDRSDSRVGGPATQPQGPPVSHYKSQDALSVGLDPTHKFEGYACDI